MQFDWTRESQSTVLRRQIKAGGSVGASHACIMPSWGCLIPAGGFAFGFCSDFHSLSSLASFLTDISTTVSDCVIGVKSPQRPCVHPGED